MRRSSSTAAQEKVAERQATRTRRLEELSERTQFLEERVQKSSALNEHWQKIWNDITEKDACKPAGQTWSQFFAMLAGCELDSTPVHFNVDETQMPKGKMLLALGKHVTCMTEAFNGESKLLSNTKVKEQRCQAAEDTLKKKAEKRLSVLVDDQLREKRQSNAKNFGSKFSHDTLTCPFLHGFMPPPTVTCSAQEEETTGLACKVPAQVKQKGQGH